MSISTYSPRRIVPGAVYDITDRTFKGQHLFGQALRPQIEASLWPLGAHPPTDSPHP